MNKKINGEEVYKKINKKRQMAFYISLVAIIIMLLFDLMTGSSGMTLKDTLKALWQVLPLKV